MMLPAEFVARYARGPSQSTVDQAKATHESVRALLGDADYLTFLQGSYKNDTALWDMNDVDIVAVSRSTMSCQFGAPTSGGTITWDELFGRIEQKLQRDPRYAGKWNRADKCVRLNTGVKIDIIPAVRGAAADSDPIALYSFRAARERRNWPRQHYEAGTVKSGRTNGAYKQSVRLLKRWVKCWFGNRSVAPSYYIECAVYAQPDRLFTGVLATDFVSIATALTGLVHGISVLPRVAGEGNLLESGEWDASEFNEFRAKLKTALPSADRAVQATSEASAVQHWKTAFNGQTAT